MPPRNEPVSQAGITTGIAAGGPILVVGCGLIGASAAAGWSAAGAEVWGWDRRDLGPLVERGWLRRAVPRAQLDEALGAAAVVLLALPVAGILAALRRLPFHAGQLVTDVGSVKVPMLAAAAALPAGAAFVGGHPMAGAERSGFEAARADLFAGATWALVGQEGVERGEPWTRSSPEGPLERVAALVRALGGEPLVCDATQHDAAVALTSHLPQLLATALAAELESRLEGEAGELALALLGPGGRDFLRLAASSWEVWRDILEHNRPEVERALEAVRGRAGQPAPGLAEEFAVAQRLAGRLGPVRTRRT